MSSKILVDVADPSKFDAGTKARNDAVAICNRLGFEQKVLFARTHGSVRRTFELLCAFPGICKNTEQSDLIVVQYPYQATVIKLLLSGMKKARKKGACAVLLLHDVLYLRNEAGTEGTDAGLRGMEVALFNSFDAVIVHNAVMRNRLAQDGVTAPMYELGVFDYLYEGAPAQCPEGPVTVAFAGNLAPEKSGFIYQTGEIQGVRFHLYGSKPAQLQTGFCYKGSFPPDVLIENMSGHYGLVWDGPSADACSGNYGEYLRYNNPHKLSLYLAAGMPVVVWSESAVAGLIADRGIGVCIERLPDLKNLPDVQSPEYRQMKEKVSVIAQEIRSGAFLQQALRRIREAVCGSVHS